MAEELSEAQTTALNHMRETFNDSNGFGMPMNDETFLRYLRARNFHIEKSTNMLKATLKWREDFQIPKLLTEWTDIVARENASGKMYVRGYDKEGRVLIYMKPTKENTHDHDGNIKHLVYTMERAVACMDAMGTGQSKLCLVIDYNGYTTSHAPPMKTSRETLTILQDHYPERLHRAYSIRPPFVFYAFFKIVSPFIDPVTKRKIVMLRDKEMQKPNNQLHTEVDVEVLEPCAGGQDEREFVSKHYLEGAYDLDYRSILGYIKSDVSVADTINEEESWKQSDAAGATAPATTPTAEEEAAAAAEMEAELTVA